MPKISDHNEETTERRQIERKDSDSPAHSPTFASPACLMHEFDSPEPEELQPDELLDLLNRLLEGERAGARALGELSKLPEDPEIRTILHAIAKDEAHFCAMLTGHIKRLGGTPSRKTGSFFHLLLEEQDLADQLSLLDRGQGWVVRKLQDAVPRISDPSLRADLEEMLDVHESNIGRVNAPAPSRETR